MRSAPSRRALSAAVKKPAPDVLVGHERHDRLGAVLLEPEFGAGVRRVHKGVSANAGRF